MTMTNCKYINDYLSKITSEAIPASKRLKKAMAYISEKLSGLDVIIDNEKAEKAVSLIEQYFKITLLDWERFIIGLIHCYYKSNDAVVFDEFYIMMGRGNGKNGFISGVGWYLTTPNHGVQGYNVDIIANSEDQAETSFNDIYEMLGENWGKLKRFYYRSKSIIESIKTKSYIKYNTSNARTKDGKRSACLIFDERHEYENTLNIGVFRSGFGKRKHSRVFSITTNGYVREGVLDDDLRLVDGVLDGSITGIGLCPLIYEMDSDEECENPDLWIKANPSLPHFPELKKEIDKDFVRRKFDKQTELDFFTKRMNRPRTNREIHVTEYDNIRATNIALPDLAGWNCVVALDYASINDFASVVAHFKNGNDRYDIHHSWLCLKSKDLDRIRAPWQQWERDRLLTAVDDVEINPELLTEYILQLGQKYNIKKIAMDNFRYALVSNALKKIGFDAKESKNVYLARPSDVMKIVPVVDSCFSNHYFAWGDDPVLRWATNNTKLIPSGRKEGTDTGNFYYGKIEAKSRKTDPFFALVHAMIIENEIETPVFGLPDVGVYAF